MIPRAFNEKLNYTGGYIYHAATSAPPDSQQVGPASFHIDIWTYLRCDVWKFSLIGRLDLLRLKFVDAVSNMKSQWKLVGQCKIIPLGKGFFTIKLDNKKDQSYIKAGLWEVFNQTLWIRNWIPDLRPELHGTSSAMVWVHYPGLSLEYWDEQTLFTISKALREPVKIDEATLNFENGLYARVLIKIDLAKKIPNKLRIKTKFGGIMQSVLLTKLPKFCHHCKIVCHVQDERRVKISAEVESSNNHVNKELQHLITSQLRRQMTKKKIQILLQLQKLKRNK
ncbi:uncharacterized protein LOC113360522 [Papaver somniferum]|uniref:uncharacterized protein LOC113360522 n=1 Tax=Papaver somniferum TaxID=3469 RepID=UPI000E6F7AAF|nr:uncharacterized protein LOC113360522 [Papaver somniferum]